MKYSVSVKGLDFIKIYFDTKLDAIKFLKESRNNWSDAILLEPQPLTKHSQTLESDLNTEINADMVNHPPHYANKDPETIQMIRAVLTKEEFIGGLKWQILKYRDRAHDKGNLEQDMAKAKFYYDLLMEVVE